MTIELREITPDNVLDCIELQPADDQKAFISPNVYSLAESKVSPSELPLAIYAGETPVGFVMYGISPADGRYWILRLMVDRQHQHRGYGRAALNEALRRLRNTPDCASVRVSYEPANTVAEKLYESLGFRRTGEMLFGEVVCELAWH